MNIVAIGGGDLGNRETFAIDRFIVELAGKPAPKALFIPTASGDAEEYCNDFADIYGKALGCNSDTLLLLSRDQDESRIREKILNADLIYVGGGYTPRMMEVWHKLGVDRLLESANRQGTVLAGISAGAICWHQWGHSNSRSYASREEFRYVRIAGLGLCSGLFCPHPGEEQRYNSFIEMIQRYGDLGIACDNGAAIHYASGHKPRVLCASDEAKVSLHRRAGGEVCRDTFCDGQTLDIPNPAS